MLSEDRMHNELNVAESTAAAETINEVKNEPAALSPGLSTVSADSTQLPAIDGPCVAELAVQYCSDIEAIIVSSGRPVQATRLAQALGLMPTESLDLAVSSAVTVEPLAAGENPAPAKKPRKRKQGPKPADPLEVVAAAISLLNEQYSSTGRAFRIEGVAGGYRLMTLARHAAAVAALQGLSAQTKLSRAAVETLAIIAYRQPVTKSHLEAIRGVSCGEVLKTLLERRLVDAQGRSEELGRPLLYGTTRQFLVAFGLASLKDLPTMGDLGLKAE